MSTDKVESAKALKTTLLLVPFCEQTKKFIINTQESLFSKILARKDLSEVQKENEIDIITAGILVAALSAHQSRYRAHVRKDDILSPYLWGENSYYEASYYPKQSKEVFEISGINEFTDQGDEDPSAYNERLVLAVGTKVMNGELPFEPKILNAIVDKHTKNACKKYSETLKPFYEPDSTQAEKELQALSQDIIDLKDYLYAISDKINNAPGYAVSEILSEVATDGTYTIEVIFNSALNKVVTTSENEKFVEGLVALKLATLARVQKQEANFGLNDGKTLATSALTLATKVGSNAVTQADVNVFITATQPYKTTHALAIALAAIIGAVVGMIAGAAVGFAVGSVPGAFIGGVAGLVIGGGIAGVSSTMWYTKKEPLNKISSAAEEMVANQLSASV